MPKQRHRPTHHLSCGHFHVASTRHENARDTARATSAMLMKRRRFHSDGLGQMNIDCIPCRDQQVYYQTTYAQKTSPIKEEACKIELSKAPTLPAQVSPLIHSTQKISLPKNAKAHEANHSKDRDLTRHKNQEIMAKSFEPVEKELDNTFKTKEQLKEAIKSGGKEAEIIRRINDAVAIRNRVIRKLDLLNLSYKPHLFKKDISKMNELLSYAEKELVALQEKHSKMGDISESQQQDGPKETLYKEDTHHELEDVFTNKEENKPINKETETKEAKIDKDIQEEKAKEFEKNTSIQENIEENLNTIECAPPTEEKFAEEIPEKDKAKLSNDDSKGKFLFFQKLHTSTQKAQNTVSGYGEKLAQHGEKIKTQGLEEQNKATVEKDPPLSPEILEKTAVSLEPDSIPQSSIGSGVGKQVTGRISKIYSTRAQAKMKEAYGNGCVKAGKTFEKNVKGISAVSLGDGVASELGGFVVNVYRGKEKPSDAMKIPQKIIVSTAQSVATDSLCSFAKCAINTISPVSVKAKQISQACNHAYTFGNAVYKGEGVYSATKAVLNSVVDGAITTAVVPAVQAAIPIPVVGTFFGTVVAQGVIAGKDLGLDASYKCASWAWTQFSS